MKRLLATVGVALLLGSCSTSDGAASIDVDLTEWAISLSDSSFAPGTVALTVANDGEFSHTLVVEDSAGNVVAATDVIAAGDSAPLEIVLDATDYRFTCRIVTALEDGTVVDHFEQGMTANLAPAS